MSSRYVELHCQSRCHKQEENHWTHRQHDLCSVLRALSLILFGKLPYSRSYDTCLHLKPPRVPSNEGGGGSGKELGRNEVAERTVVTVCNRSRYCLYLTDCLKRERAYTSPPSLPILHRECTSAGKRTHIHMLAHAPAPAPASARTFVTLCNRSVGIVSWDCGRATDTAIAVYSLGTSNVSCFLFHSNPVFLSGRQPSVRVPWRGADLKDATSPQSATAFAEEMERTLLYIRGRYHWGRRPSSDDSFHSPTIIPPSALDKPSIMKRYHRWRTTRWGVTARSPTMGTLQDTQFIECRWWNDGWTVKTVVTWRSSASMIPAPSLDVRPHRSWRPVGPSPFVRSPPARGRLRTVAGAHCCAEDSLVVWGCESITSLDIHTALPDVPV